MMNSKNTKLCSAHSQRSQIIYCLGGGETAAVGKMSGKSIGYALELWVTEKTVYIAVAAIEQTVGLIALERAMLTGIKAQGLSDRLQVLPVHTRMLQYISAAHNIAQCY